MTEGIVILLLGEFFSIISLLITNIIQNKSRDKKLTEIKEHQKENYMGILRLTIMSEEMPISERIIAGHKYIAENGNGDVKKFFKQFLKEHTK